MGYQVKRIYKDGTTVPGRWRVTWRKDSGKDENGKTVVKHRHVPATEYAKLGLKKDMTEDEAKAVIKKVNLEAERSRREDSRNKIALRLAAEKEVECIFLPPVYVAKFETEHLARRYMGNSKRLKKVLTHWSAATEAIRNIPTDLPMEKWHRYPEHFWVHFEKKHYSPSYLRNVLWVLNEWGDFFGEETGKPFRRLARPKGHWKKMLKKAWKLNGHSTASDRITFEQFEAEKESFREEHYNWLYGTMYVGLRPSEADRLTKGPEFTKITYQDKTPILWVFQTKIEGDDTEDDEWKLIPLIYPDQLKIIDIIKSKAIKRPLKKTVADRFPGCTLYMGRKSFEMNLRNRGQSRDDVRNWLGHKSQDTLGKHYENREIAHWTPIAPVTPIKRKKRAKAA